MVRQLPIGPSRELAVALHDIAWLLPRTIDLEAEIGLEPLPPSELEVMRLLVRRPGLSVGEVAREFGMQPSNASAAIRALVARGLLHRRPDQRDGRISRLTPTDRAQTIRRQREAAWGELLRVRLNRLSRADAAHLLAAADALQALATQLAGDD
ncbi:MAG: MarR family transcriptional regulator [Solirubrobacterales bacterium]|nr:MarR family transcriptional regulator [Solirubrobacterales bacterium]MBV9367970.1 MarR family transcriptional regulator [Solirubrobacterales bacterium]